MEALQKAKQQQLLKAAQLLAFLAYQAFQAVAFLEPLAGLESQKAADPGFLHLVEGEGHPFLAEEEGLPLKVEVVVLPFLAELVDLLNLAEVEVLQIEVVAEVLLKGEEERSFLLGVKGSLGEEAHLSPGEAVEQIH